MKAYLDRAAFYLTCGSLISILFSIAVSQILLALALEREHQTERARALLADLTAEFPANPLFAHELSLVDKNSSASKQ